VALLPVARGAALPVDLSEPKLPGCSDELDLDRMFAPDES